MYFVGQERSANGKVFHVMVMDLLGKNLQELLTLNGQPFDLETVLNIGIQLVQIIKDVHSQGLLYRDIKPENLLIGTSEDD